jgi:hypothetical protein
MALALRPHAPGFQLTVGTELLGSTGWLFMEWNARGPLEAQGLDHADQPRRLQGAAYVLLSSIGVDSVVFKDNLCRLFFVEEGCECGEGSFHSTGVKLCVPMQLKQMEDCNACSAAWVD